MICRMQCCSDLPVNLNRSDTDAIDKAPRECCCRYGDGGEVGGHSIYKAVIDQMRK